MGHNNLNSNKPLMSFILLTYNQEMYIKAAVESALAQNYSPLEIILSDDGSTDNTCIFMEEIIRNYQGPHSIILNINQENLGITGNVNKALELASGEYFIMAAGDDISMENRVSEICEIWLKSNKKIKSIFSNLERVDKDGKSKGLFYKSKPIFAATIQDFKKGVKCWAHGASNSFDRTIYSKFGGIDPVIRQEDGCFAFRALLEGEIFYYDKAVVKYRCHGDNISQTNNPSKRLRLQKFECLLKKGWLNDAINYCDRDPELAFYLKLEYKKARVRSFLFSLPFLGYMYNLVRIMAKIFLVHLKVIKN